MKNGFGTKSRRIEYENFDDCMDPEDYDIWQKKVISECLRILKPTGSLFYNHQPIQKKHQEIFPKYVFDFPLKQMIIWDRKNTPKLDKSYFFPTIEYIFWIQKTKDSRVKFDRKNALFNKVIWGINPDKKNKFPAPFPMELPLNCIEACTEEGDLVYDPFMGSGTVALAAKQTNRNYIGSELGDIDKINERLENGRESND
jgi:modification methylase